MVCTHIFFKLYDWHPNITCHEYMMHTMALVHARMFFFVSSWASSRTCARMVLKSLSHATQTNKCMSSNLWNSACYIHSWVNKTLALSTFKRKTYVWQLVWGCLTRPFRRFRVPSCLLLRMIGARLLLLHRGSNICHDLCTRTLKEATQHNRLTRARLERG
jgi:hypothetical protein